MRRSRSWRRSASTARSRSCIRRGRERAAELDDQVPEDVKRDRMERLVDVVQ